MVAVNSAKNGAGGDMGDAARRFGPGFLVFILLVASAIAVFWSGFFALFDAWTLPEYSHGPLIPILSFYLFLRQLKATPPPPAGISDRWLGFALILLTLVVAMIGNVAHIPDIVTYAMIVWFYGVLLVGFGWRFGREYWPPVLHLVFMLPLPSFLYWQVSINLQFVSSEIGVMVIRMMNIPVFLDGNIIDLGVYKLQVAEACSGLRYLFPVMSFTYIFAVLYQGPIWIKAVLLLSAMPITVLMNSFRIGMIGVLVDNYGIEQAEGFLHFFEGWVIFISCVLILFGLARLMQLVAGDRRPLSEALDLEFGGLGAQAARIFSIRKSAALVAAMIATALVALGWHLAPEREIAAAERSPLILFPREAGEWRSGPAQVLNPDVEAVLAADDYHGATFISNDRAAPVDLFIAYYERQTEGAGIHSPEVCIPAGGWEMSRIEPSAIELDIGRGETARFKVNRAVIQKGLNKQLVYYWFEGRGRRMTNDYLAKAATVIDALTRGRTDGGLIRVITPILSGEPESAADERLQAFLGESLRIFPRFVPE
ncbi:MAG: VPLPA-CTERM-specific exosortase XrtD [Pikeienuella sp.]